MEIRPHVGSLILRNFSRAAMAKITVLPVPDLPWIMSEWFCRRCGMDFTWIGVAVVKPLFFRPERILSEIARSEKVFVVETSVVLVREEKFWAII